MDHSGSRGGGQQDGQGDGPAESGVTCPAMSTENKYLPGFNQLLGQICKLAANRWHSTSGTGDRVLWSRRSDFSPQETSPGACRDRRLRVPPRCPGWTLGTCISHNLRVQPITPGPHVQTLGTRVPRPGAGDWAQAGFRARWGRSTRGGRGLRRVFSLCGGDRRILSRRGLA